MYQPESIEEMLSRLMPPALSEEGQRSIDEMLDELCGEEVAEIPEKRKPSWKIAAPVGIAAAAALAFGIPFFSPREKPAEPVVAVAQPAVPQIVLVGETDRIERATDEGLVADSRGQTLQAVRVRAVKENTFQDGSTGIIFHVSRPREELVLSPVNEF